MTYDTPFSNVEYAKWGDSKSTTGSNAGNTGGDDDDIVDPGA